MIPAIRVELITVYQVEFYSTTLIIGVFVFDALVHFVLLYNASFGAPCVTKSSRTSTFQILLF